MPPFAAAFRGGSSSGRGRGSGGSATGGMSNPIHFQPPAVAVPRSTVVQDEKGKEIVLHTVRVCQRGMHRAYITCKKKVQLPQIKRPWLTISIPHPL